MSKTIAYSTIMFILAVVKKLAQKIGRSNSGFGNAAKSNTCMKCPSFSSRRTGRLVYDIRTNISAYTTMKLSIPCTILIAL